MLTCALTNQPNALCDQLHSVCERDPMKRTIAASAEHWSVDTNAITDNALICITNTHCGFMLITLASAPNTRRKKNA